MMNYDHIKEALDSKVLTITPLREHNISLHSYLLSLSDEYHTFTPAAPFVKRKSSVICINPQEWGILKFEEDIEGPFFFRVQPLFSSFPKGLQVVNCQGRNIYVFNHSSYPAILNSGRIIGFAEFYQKEKVIFKIEGQKGKVKK